jgi:hypothetical protein
MVPNLKLATGCLSLNQPFRFEFIKIKPVAQGHYCINKNYKSAENIPFNYLRSPRFQINYISKLYYSFIHFVVCLMIGPWPLPSQFSTECDLVLPLAISSILSFP